MNKLAGFVLIFTFICGIALAGQVNHTLTIPRPDIDETDYGMNTPAYFAIDTIGPEPASIVFIGLGGILMVQKRDKRK